MAQNITLLGASYSDCPAVLLPKTGGGTARFDDASVTTAVASDVAQGKLFLASNGTITTGTASGGGGGIGTLLNTTAIGTISTSDTAATDTGKDVVVKGINGYDLLIVETSVDTKVASRHAATTRLIFLTCSTTIGTVAGATLATATWNMKTNNTNLAGTSRAGTTAYGIYPNDCSISTSDNGTATMNIYRRYNSTSTGTINGTYTARVYGVKLYDLIGG